MWVIYLWDEEDGAHDDNGDNKEEAEGDTEREVARKRTCSSADACHNESSRLSFVSLSDQNHVRRTHHQAKLIRANCKATNLTGHDLGLVNGDDSKLHANVDIC